MLDGVAILVCCATVKVADLIFVQLVCVVEVKREPVLASFQSLALGASKATVTTTVGMQLVHRLCTQELQKLVKF